MFESLKNTVRHTAIFALGNLGTKLVGFILLPLYTSQIPLAEYGILGLLEVIGIMAVHLVSFALSVALLRWHTLADSVEQKRRFVFTIFVSLSFSILLWIVLTWFSRTSASYFLFDSAVYAPLVFYMALSVSFEILVKIPLTLLRIEEKSAQYASVVILQFTTSLLFNIVFIAYLGMGIEGILIAQIISYFAGFTALMPYLFRRMSAGFEWVELRAMLRFCYPLVLGAAASTVLGTGDRYLLDFLMSEASVGLYTLAQKYSNVMKIFAIDPLFLGLPMVAWKVIKENNYPKRFLARSLTYTTLAFLWLGLGIAAFSRGIIQTLAQSPEYWDAYQVVPFLTLALIFLGMQKMFFFMLQISQKTKFIPLIVGVAAICNIGLNLLLIPEYGIQGAGLASILAQLLTIGIGYYFAQRYYRIDYEIGRICLLFAVAFVLFGLTLACNSAPLLIRISLKGIVVLSYPCILFIAGFYQDVERQKLKTVFSNALSRFKRSRNS